MLLMAKVGKYWVARGKNFACMWSVEHILAQRVKTSSPPSSQARSSRSMGFSGEVEHSQQQQPSIA